MLPAAPGNAIEETNPLSRKDVIDIVAGALCHCADCQRIAEPALVKNPLLRKLDRNEARDIWTALKSQKEV